MFLYVSKEVFDALKGFLTRPDVWVLRGAAQLMNDLRYLDWTTEPPTQEGWYWVRWTARHRDVIIVQVLQSAEGEGLVAWVGGADKPFALSYFHPWLGPLPEPEPPSEGE